MNTNTEQKQERRLGSHYPYEYYVYDGENNLDEFAKMLKSRGYYIGEDGHIRSKKGTITSKLMRNGYWMTAAAYDGKMYYFMEHRVIWTMINGSIPKGLVINHKNYNRGDNHIENLELMTQKENVEYSKCNMIGHNSGEKSTRALLTNKQAAAIRYVVNVCGKSPSLVAEIAGIKAHNVTRISKGNRYPDIIECESIWQAYPVLVDFTRNKTLSPVDELTNYVMGLNGECGEFTDLIKKQLYHGKEISPVDILNELGDILYYLTAICNILGIDIAEIMLNNNAKLLSRYPNGFSVSDSENRIEDKAGTIDGNGDGILNR